MKMVRLLSLLLAVATGGLAVYGLLGGQSLRGASLVATAVAAATLLLALFKLGRQSPLERWVIFGVTGAYSTIMLIAVGLHYRARLPMEGRGLLAAFLLAGLMLSLRAAYLATRKRRYGFHNYFDRPA